MYNQATFLSSAGDIYRYRGYLDWKETFDLNAPQAEGQIICLHFSILASAPTPAY